MALPATTLFATYMHEMRQRNAALCELERQCVLTLRVVFTATQPAVCSEAQTGLCVELQGLADSPPPQSPLQASVFPVCLLRSLIQGFVWLLVVLEGWGALFRLSNTITGRFGPVRCTGSEGAPLSQLKAGEMAAVHLAPPPPPNRLMALIFARQTENESQNSLPSLLTEQPHGLPNYYNLTSRFLANLQKIDKLYSFSLPTVRERNKKPDYLYWLFSLPKVRFLSLDQWPFC